MYIFETQNDILNVSKHEATTASHVSKLERNQEMKIIINSKAAYIEDVKLPP